MYGVGLNPVYIERMEARAAKKEASGEAAREREEARRAEQVSQLFDDSSTEEFTGTVVPTSVPTDEVSFAALEAEADATDTDGLTAEEPSDRPRKRHQTLRGLVRTVLSGLLNARRITEDECERALRALLAHPKSLRPPREVEAELAAQEPG